MPAKTRVEQRSSYALNFMLLCAIVFLVVCNVAAYFSLHVYLQGLGLSVSRSGVVISLYSLAAMALYAFLSSRIHVGNAFSSMVVGLLMVFVGGAGFLWATGFLELSALRVLQGAGGFFLFAPCTVLLVSIIPKGKEGSAFSLYSAALLLPYSVMPSLSDLLTPVLPGPEYLYAGTACGMVMVAVLAVALRRNLALPGKATDEDRASSRESFANLKEPTILAVLATNLFYFMIFTGLFFLFQDFARSRGMENVGLFFTIQMGVMVAIRLGANTVFDAVSPKLLITTSLIITSLGLAALVFLENTGLLAPMAILFGLGMGLCTPPLNSLLYQAGNPRLRGFNANMMVLTIHFGSFLGPSVGSWLVEWAGYIPFLTGAAITTFGVAVAFAAFVSVPRR